MKKTCNRCGQEKDIDLFFKNKSTKDGYGTICKSCRKTSRVEYYLNNRQRYIDNANRWNTENPERVKELKKKLHLKHKMIVFNHYCNNNIKCRRCGITDIRVLSINHMNWDGAEERKKFGDNLYKYIIDSEFPKGYEILCRNCNWLDYIENNY